MEKKEIKKVNNKVLLLIVKIFSKEVSPDINPKLSKFDRRVKRAKPRILALTIKEMEEKSMYLKTEEYTPIDIKIRI